jgi:hypothetical protein
MRRFDKKHNIEKANLLAEQRYLESKGLINEDETAPYDGNIPMRPLTDEEKKDIIKWVEDFKKKNRYFDPYQDFAFDYISGTKHHRIATVANLDNKSENSLWNVKIPEDAWPGKIIGNMNYTDAYKEEQAYKQNGGLYEGDEDMLFEERFNDLFKFLDAKDPQKMSQGNAYYTAPLGSSYMNKYVKDEEGNKTLNPYYGRILKHTVFMFGWADTYKRAEERRTGGDVELGARSGQYDKVKGYDVLEEGKNGYYLPILPTGSEYSFTYVDDNGNQEPIEKEEVKKYTKPPRPSDGKSKFRPLMINRISKIKAGGNEWINPKAEFEYMGPGNVNENVSDISEGPDDFKLMANLIVTRIASKEVGSEEFFDYLINNKEEVLNFVRGLDSDIPENPYLKILMLNPKESLRLLNV